MALSGTTYNWLQTRYPADLQSLKDVAKVEAVALIDSAQNADDIYAILCCIGQADLTVSVNHSSQSIPQETAKSSCCTCLPKCPVHNVNAKTLSEKCIFRKKTGLTRTPLKQGDFAQESGKSKTGHQR